MTLAEACLTLPERRPGRVVVTIGILFALAYGAALLLLRKPDGRIVIGDAVHYYVYLRSAVYDRDLQFQNDYIRIYRLRGGEQGTEWVYEPTATGHVRNMMAIGTPIAWTPLFLAVSAASLVASAAGGQYPVDGFGRLYQATAGFSGVLAAAVGAWLAFRLCERLYGARLAIWSTLLVWLASSAIYYSVVSPTYSHAVSILTVGVLLYYWGTTIDRQTPQRYAIVGAVVGLTALVRWQDAVFLIVPIVDAVADAVAGASGGRRTACTRAVVNLVVCGVAAFAVFSPQIAVWMTLYGQPVAMPQGGGWMQWDAPHIGKVLFSDWHGLFTWTPVVAFTVVGLVPLFRRDRRLATGLAAALAASWYANGSVVEWWAGEAYGARRFISCFPIFVICCAAMFDWLRASLKTIAAVSGLFVAHNFLLLLQYQAFMHGLRDVAPYPRGLYGLWLARFVVPFELAQKLWGG